MNNAMWLTQCRSIDKRKKNINCSILISDWIYNSDRENTNLNLSINRIALLLLLLLLLLMEC